MQRIKGMPTWKRGGTKQERTLPLLASLLSGFRWQSYGDLVEFGSICPLSARQW